MIIKLPQKPSHSEWKKLFLKLFTKVKQVMSKVGTLEKILERFQTKMQNIAGLAVFLDSEKAFDSVEWIYLHKCLEVFNFGPQLRYWIRVIYSDISSCVLNNGHATRHFNLGRSRSQARLSPVRHSVCHLHRNFGQCHKKFKRNKRQRYAVRRKLLPLRIIQVGYTVSAK